MKRVATTVFDRAIKRRRSDVTHFASLPNEIYLIIREILEIPWRYTLDIALHGMSYENVKDQSEEIVKYGIHISRWMMITAKVDVTKIFYHACHCGNLELIDLCLTLKEIKGPRAYLYAIAGGHIHIVESLIQRGFSTDFKSMMKMAIMMDNAEIVKYLLEIKADYDFVNRWASVSGSINVWSSLPFGSPYPHYLSGIEVTGIKLPDIREFNQRFSKEANLQRKREFIKHINELGVDVNIHDLYRCVNPDMLKLLMEFVEPDVTCYAVWGRSLIKDPTVWMILLEKVTPTQDILNKLLWHSIYVGMVPLISYLVERGAVYSYVRGAIIQDNYHQVMVELARLKSPLIRTSLIDNAQGITLKNMMEVNDEFIVPNNLLVSVIKQYHNKTVEYVKLFMSRARYCDGIFVLAFQSMKVELINAVFSTIKSMTKARAKNIYHTLVYYVHSGTFSLPNVDILESDYAKIIVRWTELAVNKLQNNGVTFSLERTEGSKEHSVHDCMYGVCRTFKFYSLNL